MDSSVSNSFLVVVLIYFEIPRSKCHCLISLFWIGKCLFFIFKAVLKLSITLKSTKVCSSKWVLQLLELLCCDFSLKKFLFPHNFRQILHKLNQNFRLLLSDVLWSLHVTFFGFSFASCYQIMYWCCEHSLSGKWKSVTGLHALILHEPVQRPFLPHPNQHVWMCVCVFVVSIVLLMGGRKAPPPCLPIVARSDDDVMAGGLEVQGTMGNYLTWHIHMCNDFQKWYLCCCYCCLNQNRVRVEEAEAEIVSTEGLCTVSAIHLRLCVWESGRAGDEINGSRLPLWRDEWLDLLWWSVFLLAECAGCSVNTPPRSLVYLFSVNRRSLQKKKRRRKNSAPLCAGGWIHCVSTGLLRPCPCQAVVEMDLKCDRNTWCKTQLSSPPLPLGLFLKGPIAKYCTCPLHYTFKKPRHVHQLHQQL